ncbi:MAG TPA: hypothetical protein VF846_05105 [Thermoanaerobaculia bacterium]|jgi:hypothetical protein
MKKGFWVLLVFVALVAIADTASAECVNCEQTTCINRMGEAVSTTACGTRGAIDGPGVTNCKTVRGCGGCMGFSCFRDGEVPMRVIRPESVVIEVVPQTDAVETVSER